MTYLNVQVDGKQRKAVSQTTPQKKETYFEPLITSCDANGVLGSTSEFPDMAGKPFMSKKHPFNNLPPRWIVWQTKETQKKILTLANQRVPHER